MSKLRICIYGGTSLHDESRHFIRRLASSILENMDAVIVTGGFFRYGGAEPESTDFAALEGARDYAESRGISTRQCFEAWLPDPMQDRQDGVVRMSEEEHDIKIRPMGKAEVNRRLALAREVDILVTIAGKEHTKVVLAQALETGTPALPLVFEKGDSAEFWKANRDRIEDWFSLENEEASFLQSLSLGDLPEQLDKAVKTVTSVLGRARVWKCLVLTPYDDFHNRLYDEVIEDAVRSRMLPDRLDRRAGSEAIRDNFVEAVEDSRKIIADVTDQTPAVMYEIGYAHGKGLKPLLFLRSPGPDPSELPVYIRDLNLAVVKGDHEELAERIRAYVSEVE